MKAFIADLRKNQRQFFMFFILFFSLIALVYFFLFLMPQLADIVDTVKRIGRISGELRAGKSDVARLDTLRKTVEEYKDKIESYEKRLPAEQEIPSLLQNLSDMAKNSNVKIVSITPVEEPPKEQKSRKGQIYQEIPILISAKSGYHELGHFLGDLENSDRFMKVADIRIKSSSMSPKKHDVDLLILTYILLK